MVRLFLVSTTTSHVASNHDGKCIKYQFCLILAKMANVLICFSGMNVKQRYQLVLIDNEKNQPGPAHLSAAPETLYHRDDALLYIA